MNNDDLNLFVEETLPDYSYSVVWRGTNGIRDISEALSTLQNHPSKNRLELWSKAHAQGPKGFGPMAFRERNSMKVKISHTLKMLLTPTT